MFFRTQLKSVGVGGAVDMQGRQLAFIGYLPCKAGDWVYTDGTVIFGNVKPRGTPDIFDSEPSGIPVLCDDLRGYFTSRGKFKKYKIARDDWIVNSQKQFNHNTETFDGATVIDADVTDNGNKFLVTEGLYQKVATLDLILPAIHSKDSRYWGGYWDYITLSIEPHTPYTITYVDPITGEERTVTHNEEGWDRLAFWNYIKIPVRVYAREQTLGRKDVASKNIITSVVANEKQSQTFSLEPYAKEVERRALTCANDLMNYSWVEENAEPLPYEFEGYNSYDGKNYQSYDNRTLETSTRPAEPFIAQSCAYVLSANFDENGISGVIFASAYGFCFPLIQPRFKASFNNGYCYVREWKCIPFGSTCIFKFQSDTDNLVPFAFRYYGGLDSNLTVIGDNLEGVFVGSVTGSPQGYQDKLIHERHVKLSVISESREWTELLPVGYGFYHMNKFGRLTFYNADKKIVAENIPVHEYFYHIEIEHGFFQPEKIAYYLNDKPSIKYKIYTVDGNTEEKELDTNKTSDPLPIDGYYIKYPTGLLEPLNFTPLFYQFKNGSCLCGVKGGKLYKVDRDGNIEQVGDGLKNFRLRELKKISKAKK